MDGIVRLKWINHEMFFSVFVNILTISQISHQGWGNLPTLRE